MLVLKIVVLISMFSSITSVPKYFDICSITSPKKLYIEYGNFGQLIADSINYPQQKFFRNFTQRKCSTELITCPSCLILIKFKLINIPKNDLKIATFSTCGSDYIFLYELPLENASGEQFCGYFNENNSSEVIYYSKTRLTTLDFVFTRDYGHAFTLEFHAIRNRVIFEEFVDKTYLNNASQRISSPHFPQSYPADLSSEYLIKCNSKELCRIVLLFTDFLIADSSILEFFDFNGQRMYVISGNIFRPLLIITSGPSLTVRFYANGVSGIGFKAKFDFSLKPLDETDLNPNIHCGGQVSNLGGAITMMNMTSNGDDVKLFDCIWIVKISENFLHRKTHLYVKVIEFSDFAGPTKLNVRRGATSENVIVESLKYPLYFSKLKEKEHIVTINEAFYISLRGYFNANSKLTIVYAAFNSKDCFPGLDFFCENLRCISALLTCDGFDNCGDNSDELLNCSMGHFLKIPNFLFPKTEQYNDLRTATLVFLLCAFGLIGIILTMALLLYRVNIRARHHRQIQNHIHTIHAIFGDLTGMDGEEEIINSDDPPDYEPPPEYSEVLKCVKKITCMHPHHQNQILSNKFPYKIEADASSSRSCETFSSPPDYSCNIEVNNNSYVMIKKFFSDDTLLRYGAIKDSTNSINENLKRSSSTSEIFNKFSL